MTRAERRGRKEAKGGTRAERGWQEGSQGKDKGEVGRKPREEQGQREGGV